MLSADPLFQAHFSRNSITGMHLMPQTSSPSLPR
jgi:hypothetical protein